MPSLKNNKTMGAIAGASMVGQLAMTMLNNQLQQERADRDRAENYRYGELAAQNADARTRALYNDFYSPQALLRQYQEAGLSPSLMFGGTPGQGGMSGAQGTGAAGMQTPFMPYSIVEAAQARALNAQAEKAEAEADTISGKNDRGTAEIQNILASTGNTKAQTAFTDSQRIFQELQNYVKDATKDFEIKQVETQLNLVNKELEIAVWNKEIIYSQWQFINDTYDTNVQITTETYNNLVKDALLKQSQIDLNKGQQAVMQKNIEWLNQQINESINRIAQGWHDLAIKGATLQAQKDYWEKSIKNEKQRIDNDWEIKVRECDIKDEQIRQNYIGMGADMFNNTIRIGSQILMLKGLKSTPKGGQYYGRPSTTYTIM